jgi:hypothetical protein
MRSVRLLVTISAFATASLATASLAGATLEGMHPKLGARLTGMGEHGVVNLQSTIATRSLCWTFDLKTSGITGASIRDAHGMIVARLGSSYVAKGCATVRVKALELIESKPGAYRVWVDTKGHPGDLRGTLFAGMAHM